MADRWDDAAETGIHAGGQAPAVPVLRRGRATHPRPRDDRAPRRARQSRLRGRTSGSRPDPRAKLQATGIDARRAASNTATTMRSAPKQEEAEVREAHLVRRAAAGLCGSRWSEHIDARSTRRASDVCAMAISADQSRVVPDRIQEKHTKRSRTYGVTTLRKSSRPRARHPRAVPLPRRKGQGSRFARRSSTRSSRRSIRAALRDSPDPRLFRYQSAEDGALLRPQRPGASTSTSRSSWARLLLPRLPHLGRHAHGGDRARREGPSVEGEREQKRVVAAVMRHVGEQLGTRLRSRGARTSLRRSSSNTSTEERSRISGRGICASSPRGISASIRRNGRYAISPALVADT